jgi:hypothetical protein
VPKALKFEAASNSTLRFEMAESSLIVKLTSQPVEEGMFHPYGKLDAAQYLASQMGYGIYWQSRNFKLYKRL